MQELRLRPDLKEAEVKEEEAYRERKVTADFGLRQDGAMLATIVPTHMSHPRKVIAHPAQGLNLQKVERKEVVRAAENRPQKAVGLEAKHQLDIKRMVNTFLPHQERKAEEHLHLVKKAVPLAANG